MTVQQAGAGWAGGGRNVYEGRAVASRDHRAMSDSVTDTPFQHRVGGGGGGAKQFEVKPNTPVLKVRHAERTLEYHSKPLGLVDPRRVDHALAYSTIRCSAEPSWPAFS